MKHLFIILATIAVLLLATTATAVATYWGYAQERDVKYNGRIFARTLRWHGIDAKFKFFKDGSWQITGCVSDGLCQDERRDE